MRRDVREHIMLGDRRGDGENWGEAAWTLLGQTMWPVPRWTTTAFQRMPLPYWWHRIDWNSIRG